MDGPSSSHPTGPRSGGGEAGVLTSSSAATGTGHRWRSTWGPAWIVMIADVDAASILTAVASGVAYHYDLIWFLLLLTAPLFFIQEAAGRLGAVTRKGLAQVVREARSPQLSLAIAIPASGADVVSFIAEYSAIALGLGIFGVPPYISLPLTFVVHIALVARGRYVWIERALLAISAVFIVTVGSTLLVHGILPYNPVYVTGSPPFLLLLAANAGGVFMPFMLFFQSSATAEKQGSTVRWLRRETFIAAFVSEVLLVIFLMLGAGIPASADLFTASGLASALAAVGGSVLPYIFGIGLVAAAFLAVVVISLSAAWGVVGALGWRRNRGFWVIVAESIPAVIVPLVYPHPLAIVLVSLVLLVFILIGPAILLGHLAADPVLMGSDSSRGFWKWAYWVSLGFVIACGLAALV